MASVSENVFRRGAPLDAIICDGWARDLTVKQILKEASNAGYANCVTEKVIPVTFARMDLALAAWEAKCTARPDLTQEFS